jgi:hypothetical protein
MSKPLDQRVKDILKKRFISKVDKSSDCWNWVAHCHKTTGYGRFGYKGKPIGAHRASYMLYKGSIPKGMSVLHKCNNRKCVNPSHLYIGNHKDNAKDSIAAGTIARGERHGKSKLCREDIVNIREFKKEGMYHKDIAKIYKVRTSTVTRIVNNQRWQHV